MGYNSKGMKRIIVIVVAILLVGFLLYRLAVSRSAGTDGNGYYGGYVIITDKDVFFEARENSNFFSAGQLVRINYQSGDVLTDFPADTVGTGDEIRMEIHRIGELIPPVAMVNGFERIKAGSIDNIDPQNMKELEESGYIIIE